MLQYIFNNNEALYAFINNKFPDINQVKRTVLLELRKNNVKAPDHLYRLKMQDNEKYFESFVTLFTDGIKNLSNNLIEDRNNKFYIFKEQFFNWQETITLIPPSVLIASAISSKCINNKITVWKDWVLPNTEHTMLLSPHIIQLESSVRQWRGLNELHIHLNGSLEVDKVWQDYLSYPHKIKANLEKVKAEKPLEQFSQEGFLLTPQNIFDYLCIAKGLRQYFFSYLFKKNKGKQYTVWEKSDIPFFRQEFTDKESLLQYIIEYGRENWSKTNSPFDSYIDKLTVKPENYPSLECFMFAELFSELRCGRNEMLAQLFYCYLLIYGLINRLLSHQLHQNGFEQFQKITMNELREFSEEKFNRRFKQYAGNDLSFLKLIEGRISPKKTVPSWDQALAKIKNGWLKFKNVANTDVELKLIIHFIKRPDNEKKYLVRHYILRKELYIQGHVIRGLLRLKPAYKDWLSGIDAASSEFDAPPEVFAPVFRMMRNLGFKHFTYHAGEDFYHIVTGMRAIYEAIIFCDLRNGDRIGHAVALGLDPVQWGAVTGEEIRMRRGDHLDDLVFLFYVIREYKIEKFYTLLNLIKSRAEHLYFEIYDCYLPVETVIAGWQLRKCCPVYLGFHSEDVGTVMTTDDFEADLCNVIKGKTSESVMNVYKKYHDSQYSSAYNEKISVHTGEFIVLEDLTVIQKSLLEMMNSKEIIIETLPMSNVRIGFHQDFSTYHLWNWIKWKKQGIGVPPIIIGSDDTGIFATNIFNEYANIYLMLIQHHKMSHTDAIALLDEFRQNGEIYKFVN